MSHITIGCMSIPPTIRGTAATSNVPGRWFSRVSIALVLLTLSLAPTQDVVAQDVSGGVTLDQERSAGLALGLSFLGSFVPAVVGYNLSATGAWHGPETALFLFGVYIGPSLGHFYAGRPNRAFGGIAIRAGILAATALALSQTGVCLESCSSESTADEVVVVVASVGLTLLSATIDILGAPGSARKTNRERSGLAFEPWFSPSTGSLGLKAIVRF